MKDLKKEKDKIEKAIKKAGLEVVKKTERGYVFKIKDIKIGAMLSCSASQPYELWEYDKPENDGIYFDDFNDFTKRIEAFNNPIYTVDDWEKDGTFRAGNEQEIEEEVYYQMLEVMPIKNLGYKCWRTTEPYTHDEKGALYMGFKEELGKYYYIGLVR